MTRRQGAHSDPPTFVGWRQTEAMVEARSLAFIGEDKRRENLGVAISAAADLIFKQSARYPDDEPCGHTDGEHTILYLATAVFNGTKASWCLLLRGYYGPALAVQRQVVEAILLLQRFALRPEDASKWRQATRSQRIRDFGASQNKGLLEMAGEPHLYRWFAEYSELAAHATPRGHDLTQLDGRFWTGSHFNPELFDQVLRDMALHVVFACDVIFGFQFLDNPEEEVRQRLRDLLDTGMAEDSASKAGKATADKTEDAL